MSFSSIKPYRSARFASLITALCSLLSILVVRNFILAQCVLDIRSSLLLIHRAEDQIHLFQGPALCLFQENANKDAHGGTEHSKHDECLPADLVHGTGRHFRDDKVEEPLSGRSETDAI